MAEAQPQFTHSVPENYHRYLVPTLFQGFATSLAEFVQKTNPQTVLELACGTGAVTRALATHLPSDTRIVATDFSDAMLAFAVEAFDSPRAVEWRPADACSLPFEDESFDSVICQFGVMFFPDKPQAMAEALRVLKPGGNLLFNTWGDIQNNLLFQVIEETLSELLPEEETPFMPTPFTQSDPELIRTLVESAGFDDVRIWKEDFAAGLIDPDSLASGFAFGTPLGLYLSGQGHDLTRIHEALSTAFDARFGTPVRCQLQALFCQAEKR